MSAWDDFRRETVDAFRGLGRFALWLGGVGMFVFLVAAAVLSTFATIALAYYFIAGHAIAGAASIAAVCLGFAVAAFAVWVMRDA
jgi:hypothetical protein